MESKTSPSVVMWIVNGIVGGSETKIKNTNLARRERRNVQATFQCLAEVAEADGVRHSGMTKNLAWDISDSLSKSASNIYEKNPIFWSFLSLKLSHRSFANKLNLSSFRWLFTNLLKQRRVGINWNFLCSEKFSQRSFKISIRVHRWQHFVAQVAFFPVRGLKIKIFIICLFSKLLLMLHV